MGRPPASAAAGPDAGEIYKVVMSSLTGITKFFASSRRQGDIDDMMKTFELVTAYFGLSSEASSCEFTHLDCRILPILHMLDQLLDRDMDKNPLRVFPALRRYYESATKAAFWSETVYSKEHIVF